MTYDDICDQLEEVRTITFTLKKEIKLEHYKGDRGFNFKIDDPSKKQIGVVAQELETVCPGLVKDNPDLDENNKDLGTTTKSVKSSILYMKAIKALQEAITRIETLETEVAALKAK